eukprot:CAMPEP_0177480792 /NCGR_PEP_ID=MMETSP0369-20130122/26019_1 /TAXON_ID=447022 ORGANISM="Scrippsiella hangoei-like, Strain SHHI-4" /NCGR_SAMPLE_ID=MMETSP0369 /ASSEMBLY_ACC=CAM_ASM_000364 /LENGTH=104 /DNA_ID=CAMNT_0018956533 /DNA_START=327 /DNA_END=639 /DNA_ORIENTATION=+
MTFKKNGSRTSSALVGPAISWRSAMWPCLTKVRSSMTFAELRVLLLDRVWWCELNLAMASGPWSCFAPLPLTLCPAVAAGWASASAEWALCSVELGEVRPLCTW